MIGTFEDLLDLTGDHYMSELVNETYLLIERAALPKVEEKHPRGKEFIYVGGDTTYTYPGVETDILEDMVKDLAHLDWTHQKSIKDGVTVRNTPEGTVRVAKKLQERANTKRDWDGMTDSHRLDFIKQAEELIEELGK